MRCLWLRHNILIHLPGIRMSTSWPSSSTFIALSFLDMWLFVSAVFPAIWTCLAICSLVTTHFMWSFVKSCDLDLWRLYLETLYSHTFLWGEIRVCERGDFIPVWNSIVKPNDLYFWLLTFLLQNHGLYVCHGKPIYRNLDFDYPSFSGFLYPGPFLHSRIFITM